MAQSPDGSGSAPVRITKSSTSVVSGVGVTQKLVGAAIAFGNVLRGTFGPNGLDKMLYKSNGEAAVTNDGPKIVAELLVKHPAAKMMVSMANSQEENCGDGVTTTMLLCGSLLQEGNNLLKKGLHPLTLVDGFRKSLEIAKEQIGVDSTKIDEEKFVTDGFGSQLHDLMYNDFMLVGPKNDPAKIGTAKTTIEAFQKIAAAKARFASRSDDSGTHKAELRFWQTAGATPKEATGKWYLETGLGMGATLNFAVQADAYALTDRATWLTFKNKTTHMPLHQGDPALFNQYGVVLVSQTHCPTIKAAESRIFVDWLLSPKGQNAIATFQHENRPLFFPNATP